MRQLYPWTVFSPVLTKSILSVLFSLSLTLGYATYRTYTTTGASTDWDDPAAWTCTGGGCYSNPTPPRNLYKKNVIINHNITFTSDHKLQLKYKGKIIVNADAKLTVTNNMKIRWGGRLEINGGQVQVGSHTMYNYGKLIINDGLFTKDGSFVNKKDVILSNGCVILTSGNFYNDEDVEGNGAIKVENGNIDNDEDWSHDVIYFFSGSGHGLPGSPSTEQEVDEVCLCNVGNCDIIPAYPVDPKVEDLIGAALVSLANNFDPEVGFNEFIYQIRNNSEVLIEIVLFENNYQAVLGYLGTLGITPGDLISDVYNMDDDLRVITVFFPINELYDADGSDPGKLNNQTNIRQVFEVSPPIPNQGLIDSQGDFAQNSNLARLGWNLSGAGVKIGVISDSFDRISGVITGPSAAVQTDITNGDLPGGANAVNVLEDYPYGPASDEGRAMLQIVHDVVPEAELYFHTGFVSEGNMASGIADLVAAGCDIIVDDLTYLKAPMFTDGVIAQAIEDATAAGVTYFTSAGNFGVRSYEDTYSAVPGTIRHDFGGGATRQALNLDVGQYIMVLQWDDEWSSLGSGTGAMQDMDLYLVNDDDSILYGFNRNNVGNDPVEIMAFTVVNSTNTNVAIENPTGGAMAFKYVVFRAGNDGEFGATPAISESTVVGHANSESVIAVGAVRYDNTPNFGGSFNIQQSSSRGGTQTDGVIRQQPLISSPTGVDTSVDLGAPDFEGNGLPNFFGTSASAPHAAGIAGLVAEAKTRFGVTDPALSIRNLLVDNATDIGTPGYDFESGFGFVLADNVVASFANPIPNLVQFNLENLTPGVNPGEEEFDLILEGSFFTEESIVIFRDEELETTFVDENSLIATIPEFIGNPPIYVFTPPNEPITNGLDGGASDPLTFLDIVKLDVVVQANEASKRYGESNPTFDFFTDVDDTGTPLGTTELDLLTPSVSLSTAATSTSSVGIYAIEVELTNVDVGLTELYNFIPEPGVFLIDPMPVTIQPSAIDPIVYGDPLPEITFDYTYGEPGGTPATVDETVASTFALNHTNILSLANGGFGIVDPGNLTNILSIVNDEPNLNGLSIANINIYASESTLEQAGTVSQNLLSLVNGTGNEKVVFIGADLFDPQNIENGDLSTITNLLSLVNILSIANGTSLVNGLSIANGLSLTNILSIANGDPITNIVSLVNGALSLVNGTPITNSAVVQSVFDALANGFSIVNTSDIPADPATAPPIPLVPINVYTGCNVGTQYVIPGGIIDNNFIVYYEPRAFEILPAHVIVTTQDASTTYGSELPEFTVEIDGIVPKDSEEDVFPDGIEVGVDCAPCGVAGSPHVISAEAATVSPNYNVTYNNAGWLTVHKFDLTVMVDNATITYGDAGPFDFTVSSDPPELPYDELLTEVLGDLSFTPTDGCSDTEVISVDPEVQPDNYNVTYVDGHLTYENAIMTISIEDVIVQATGGGNHDDDDDDYYGGGDPTAPIPGSFNYTVSGLVCDDAEPVITHFQVLDSNGHPVSGELTAGEYTVLADVSGLTGYDRYHIEQVPGTLLVSPEVNCSDRIRAKDVCKEPAGLEGDPLVTTRVRFTYKNRLNVPIFVPNGNKNKFTGNGYHVGSPPELFLPGEHTFEIYTDGGNKRWKIKTPGCHDFSVSSNARRADLCAATARVDITDFEDAIIIDEGIASIYPNPAEGSISFPMHGQHTSFSVKVFDEVGMLIKQKEYPENTYYDVTMDISMLKSGILYFMIHKHGTRPEVHRIMKR